MPHHNVISLLKKKKRFNLFCVNERFAWKYMYHLYAYYLQRSEEGVGSSGIGVMDICEPPNGFWEIKHGSFARITIALNC